MSGKTLPTSLTALCLIVVLSGCGGGESTTTNPNTAGVAAVAQSYSGVPPATADVQAFKLNVWDNLSPTNRCGSCHGTGDQAPTFVRDDDINLAYAEANGIVDMVTPADSRMVTKVTGGHNCWLASDQACGDVITAYITAWSGGAVGSGTDINAAREPFS